MTDKKHKRPTDNLPKVSTEDAPPPVFQNAPGFPEWLLRFWPQAFIVVLLSLTFYGNTWNNEFALDDAVVVIRNEYVLEGFSGIPDILTKDAYDSYYKQIGTANQLYGGRYRPLSIVTFAIEQQFLGAIPKDQIDNVIRQSYDPAALHDKTFQWQLHVRHLFNVLWFALSMVVLLYFLRYVVFRSNPIAALIATIIFTIHPIHTEVVANIKSRDEIMSLLFICLTFICAFKTLEHKKRGWLIAAVASYFLAFLSKEYAITLIGLLPLSFYIFNKRSIKKSLVATLPYVPVVILYLCIRLPLMQHPLEAAQQDVQVNPYAYASNTEKTATVIATSLDYLKLLVFPIRLTSDYSYAQIPYKDYSWPIVWISLAVHLLLFALLIWLVWRRNLLGFAIAFFLANLLMVNNFVFDIGATMGERLIYHSSLGFAIAIGCLQYHLVDWIKSPLVARLLLALVMLILIALCGYKTINRNKDWKNDETLYFQDIKTSPNSFLISSNVASLLVNNSDFEPNEQKRIAQLRAGIQLFDKVLDMQRNYVLGYMNRAVAYLKLNNADSLVLNLDIIRNLYPIHQQLPEMYFYAGDLYQRKSRLQEAKAAFRISLELNPRFEPAEKGIKSVDSALSILK